MIPWLTECIKPNGLPSAITQVPTGASSLFPSRAAGRSSRSSFRTAMSALASVQTFTGKIDAPSRRNTRILDGFGAINHVVIGQDVKPGGAVASDDHARAGLLKLPGTPALVGRGSSSRRRCAPPPARPPWPPARTFG